MTAQMIAPQAWARTGGLLYLVVIVAGLFGEAFVRSSLVVGDDPTATARNILGSESLFRSGMAAELFALACDAAIALVFFGCSCLALGHLLARSGYFPAFLGVLMSVAGLGYVLNSFVRFLAPAVATQLGPSLLLPGFVAETTLCLWLIARGVDLTRWNERAVSP